MPVPIIFVTSRDTNADELKSIQVGGIDFITKPYDTLILLEKIKRALQLSNPNNFRELVKKDCTLDLHLSILKYQEQSIELTRNEFRILYYFFMNEDKVISKERKRNTLLMYYFLEMTESEIANLQKITQSGVFRNRHHALETMKKILKEKQ